MSSVDKVLVIKVVDREIVVRVCGIGVDKSSRMWGIMGVFHVKPYCRVNVEKV